MAGPVQFDLASAARVARVVRAVEDQSPRARSLGYDAVQSPNLSRLMVCQTQSAWDRNTTATLNVLHAGTPPNEEQTPGRTLSAVNKLHYVLPGIVVLVAKAGNGRWYMVNSFMPPVLHGTFSGAWAKNTTKSVAVVVGGANHNVDANNLFAEIEAGDGTKNCAIAYNSSNYMLIAAEC